MSGEVILYNTEDGGTQLLLQVVDGKVWLSQAEMAALFQTTPQNVTLHIRAIDASRELDKAATCKDHLQGQTEDHLVAGATVKDDLTVQSEGKATLTRPRLPGRYRG